MSTVLMTLFKDFSVSAVIAGLVTVLVGLQHPHFALDWLDGGGDFGAGTVWGVCDQFGGDYGGDFNG